MNNILEVIKRGDKAAFRELFEDYYPVICVFAMKKNAEIAAELSIAEGTVHTLKKTAYKKLRDQLQEHFYLLLFWI